MRGLRLIESSSSDDDASSPSSDDIISDDSIGSDAGGSSSSKGDGPAIDLFDSLSIAPVNNTACAPTTSQAKKTLMPHQRVGVEWLLSLYNVRSGAILADDMGLGKTYQVASFVHALFQRKMARRVLIVAPKTLLGAWENEVRTELGMEMAVYGGTQRATSKRERLLIMDDIASRGGILMMTYGLVQRDAEVVRTHMSHDEDEGPFWDVVVMDEGHTLKNTGNKTRAEIEKVDARMRLLITGTPIQNNLMELHSLFDLVKRGLLGDASEFKDTFERPIKRGTSKDATRREQDAGAMASVSLQKTYAPFMLRRTKEDVMGTSGSGGGGSDPSSSFFKKDIVVWLRLTDAQLGLYKAFLRSKSVREVLNQNRAALASLTVLKKICKHPMLLSDELLGLEGTEVGVGPTAASAPAAVDDELRELRESTEWKDLQHDRHDRLVSASCKTLFVMGLLHMLIATGHRTLVFSESKVMLGILEQAIASRGWKYLRIDGDVDGAVGIELDRRALVRPGSLSLALRATLVRSFARSLVRSFARSLVRQERHARVKRFQEDAAYSVFLLTSQVGGLGLTLTAADRVVLLDPSWNPSVDNQSVDRACRLGQTKDVLVYRLVTCGTIEDKVYQKQVFKGAIFKAGTEQGEQQRYFNESDTQVVIMQDLFTLAPEEFQSSSTQRQLEARHRHQRKIPPAMQREIDALDSIESYVGFSDHDLLYSEVSAVSENIAAAARVFTSATTPKGKGKGGGGGNGDGGGDQLAAMFDKALSLGNSRDHDTARDQDARTQLEADLAKQEKLLANASLVSALPDGGAKIRATVDKMRAQLRDMKGPAARAGTISTEATALAPALAGDADATPAPIRHTSPDLLAAVRSGVSEPTPQPKQPRTQPAATGQEQQLVLKSKFRRAKAELHRKAKELEAYRLGTNVKLAEDARRKADVEQQLDAFIKAKAAYEHAIGDDA